MIGIRGFNYTSLTPKLRRKSVSVKLVFKQNNRLENIESSGKPPLNRQSKQLFSPPKFKNSADFYHATQFRFYTSKIKID
jgi:hypothetical protein